MMMRFGFLLPHLIDRNARDPFGESKRICQLAESLGYDFVVVGQHHFTPGYVSAPFTVLAAIAAATERLRLCTGIVILPLHHPLTVAEQVAQLDELSGGRAVLGVGTGYRRYEFDALGVPFDQRVARMESALELLPNAWTGSDAEVPRVVPAPLQVPHPPIWVGARGERPLERAARLADGWMTGLSQPVHELKSLAEAFLAFPRPDDRRRDICMMRHLGIGESRHQVEKDWLEPALQFYVDYWDAGARADKDPDIVARAKAGQTVTLEEFANDRAVAGTPDECLRQVADYVAQTQATEVCIVTQSAGPVAFEREIRLFSEGVIAHWPGVMSSGQTIST
ncbi:LLM class flavin-dependent oxidoreductase [Nocardioides bizhenqiangii]|uniref:LLM class flavin-dependent oxidoreductase n=1 Tax=Nocardioides bizhenqiangii TaxID=3095076 RepID=A0ABZ0ZM82_9ACTN|nr:MULTISPECIES: LLM class flavin-dependent oxidoreductase [unclassified Nocardioides]MDZ5621013.1 LLM class flavin-dependent oxidoreductase [Nocardioides sp. HM23]WQQ25370.1 LLM class flavin-dependent oxidoreductase [Nocardioides sp. HM61]